MKKLTILLLLSTSLSTFAGSQLDFTLSDFCFQQPNVQDRGGVYYFPNKEVGITKSSLCVFKDAYGQYASKGKLIDGKKDGKWTWWYENGQYQSITEFKEGKREGKSVFWYKSSQKNYEANYKDNKLNGKFTQWYENGQTSEESNYKNGKCISGYCYEKAEAEKLAKEKAEVERLAKGKIEAELKSLYVNQIASRIKSFWRYQGAEDYWSCQVYVLQDMNGVVQSVNLQSCDIDDSAKAKSFRDSIERAVYKASPLPTAPTESVFIRELILDFRVD